MEQKIKLTYVITTYNKLPYLKNVVSTLLKYVDPDEEVIVTDGGSKDGTKEYLDGLLKEGKIHQFISEKDKGEAHGWNKAFLLARGQLIKVITDDDVFYYPGIKKCKEFMLQHPEIDILGTDGVLSKAIDESAFIGSKKYSKNYYNVTPSLENNFNEWKIKGKPFSFCGLGWMMRRSSIAIFGLLDTAFVRVDGEFTLRLTAGKANLGWYTGFMWMRILNLESNSATMSEKIKSDTEKLNLIYPDSNLEEDHQFTWHDLIPKSIKPALRSLRDKITKKKMALEYIPTNADIENIFRLREDHLAEVNKKETGRFLYKI